MGQASSTDNYSLQVRKYRRSKIKFDNNKIYEHKAGKGKTTNKNIFSQDIDTIAKCIKLSNEKRQVKNKMLDAMLAKSGKEEKVLGDSSPSKTQAYKKWMPIDLKLARSPAKPIKNWTSSNKNIVLDHDRFSNKTTTEFTELFQKLERRNLMSKDGINLEKGEKKRSTNLKKAIRKKSEKQKEQEKVLYSEDDRQKRLKKLYFLRNNELPYQNASGFAKLMKELKEKFNGDSEEKKRDRPANLITQDQTAEKKIDFARKKLYSMTDRTKSNIEQKIHAVNKQKIKIFTSCEREDTPRKELESSTNNQIPFLKRCRMKNTDISPKLENDEAESKVSPFQRRYRSSNGNSRIYFYKKPPLDLIHNKDQASLNSGLCSSLDPSRFVSFLKKVEAPPKRSVESMKIKVKDRKTTWVQDEHKNWKKITAFAN